MATNKRNTLFWIVIFFVIIILGTMLLDNDNGSSKTETAKKIEPEKTLTIITICEAAQKSNNSRVRVEGNFDGFSYEINSKEVSLESNNLCNNQGAGLVFATLKNSSEKERLSRTKPGTQIILEGKINKIEQNRFVYITNAIVISK